MPQVKTTTAILSKDPFKIYLRIEGDLPRATNRLLGHSRWVKHNNATKWKMIVGNAVEQHLPKDLLEFADISITRHYYRMLDFDGLVASMKPIVDGLKNLVIQDDRWHLTGPWRVNQEFRPKKDGPLIEIWVTEAKERPIGH